MELNLKVEKMKDMGFMEIDNNEFILIYKGHKWTKSAIENTSIAEIIKYKSFYDGDISLFDLNKFLDIIRNY